MKSAKKIAADILEFKRPRIDNYLPQDLHRIIMQEIKTVQREALEAAAARCERYARTVATTGFVGQDLAKEIRALIPTEDKS